MTKPAPASEKSALDLFEEGFHLVRLASAGTLASYAIGTLPFVLALLFFWSDMSRSAFAEERLLPGVVALTGLFVWMKAWQSLFCQRLMAVLAGVPAPPLTARNFLRTAVYQAIVQPAGLFLIPLAAVVMLPFAWVYGFFTSATVLNGDAPPNLRVALARSWHQARLWPLQNHWIITLATVFGFFVFLNLLTALAALPILAKTLLGIESVFTLSPAASLNTTLLAAQAALSYLCLDPVLKAIYTLRCFHGESLSTGRDLLAELNLGRQTTAHAPATSNSGILATASGPHPRPRPRAHPALPLALTLLCAGGLTSAPAADVAADADPIAPAAAESRTASPTGKRAAPVIDPGQLDESIDRTVKRAEFTWRQPRERNAPGAKEGEGAREESYFTKLGRRFENSVKAMEQWIDDGLKWLQGKLRGTPAAGPRNRAPVASLMEDAMIFLIALLVIAVVWLLVRVFKDRSPVVRGEAVTAPAAPDLRSEQVHAAELPEDGWIHLAQQLLAQGETRLALRAFYLAGLAHLGERHLIALTRFKSNRDYERELRRRAHALGALPQLFSDQVTDFERVWYGNHEPTPEILQSFSERLDRMKGRA